MLLSKVTMLYDLLRMTFENSWRLLSFDIVALSTFFCKNKNTRTYIVLYQHKFDVN